MGTRYFNWKLAIVLMVALAIFVGAAVTLHRWQRVNRAVQSLPLGEEAYARQDWDQAADQLGNYLTINRDDVERLVKYADAQLKRRPQTPNNVNLAVAAYQDARRLDGRHREATRRLIEIYLWPSWNAPREARLTAEDYLKNGEDVEIRRMLADALWQLRMPKEAAGELNKILQTQPNDVLAYEKLGMLAESYPDTIGTTADIQFDEAVAKNPESALAYVARASFHLRHQRLDKAVADLDQARKYDLPDAETRGRLVAGLIGARLLDQAREQLKAWQAQDPTELLLWQCWAALAQRANALAMRANDPALQARSRDEMYTVAETGLKTLATQPWDFLPTATELLILAGHVQEANNCIDRMRQKDVAPRETPYLEGLVAEREGKLREAIVAWRKAITLGFRQAGMVRQMLARALERMGDTQSAIGEYRILVTSSPTDPNTRTALARLLVQTGEWSEVQDQALQILRLAPGRPEAVLMELQARMNLPPASAGPAAEREQAWQDIERRLVELDKANQDSLLLKLLQTQVALIRDKFSEAASMLGDLESKYPSDVRVAMLQAQLLVVQSKAEDAKNRFREIITKFPQALEPVRGLASLLNQQNQRPGCETVLQEGLARIQESRTRRDLGLILADYYRQWREEDKLTAWLGDLAVQFPGDIRIRRLLLLRPALVKDPAKAQGILDEIKALEGGEGDWQWRYEQARFWNSSGGDEFKTRYAQIVKLLQENLQTNPRDQESRWLLANTYEKAGEWSLAAAAYQEVQRAMPSNIPVLVRTIAVLNKAQEFDEARDLLDEADRLNLQHPDLDRLRLSDNTRRGKVKEVESGLEKIVSRDPNDTASSLKLAALYTQQKKYGEAQKVLDRLAVRAPDSMPLAEAQANLYAQQDKADEAIRLCDQIVDKLQAAPAYMFRARVYTTLKQYDKAIEDLGRVIALDSKSAPGWASRADFYRAIGRPLEGISDMRKALELAPDDVTIRGVAAVLFLDAFQRQPSRDPSLLDQAETSLNRALAGFEKSPPGNPQDPQLAPYTQLRLLKAQVLMLKGAGPGIESARRILREVTSSQPTLAEPWELMGRLELSQEEPSKALDAALRGLAHNEGNARLLLLKARAEKTVRSPAIAALTFKGLLDQDPKNVDVLIELADAYALSGQTQQAVDLLREKLPEFEGRERRRCEIAQAEALYANKQKDEAKALFEKLMQADPSDPSPIMTWAQELRRDRRWTEMNLLVERWVTAHPQDAAVATTIAQVLAATGDQQALAIGENILRKTLLSNPKYLPALMLLGMMMQDAGRNEESMERNRQILQLDPNNVIAMNNLAWMLCKKENEPDQYQEALALAEKGLRIVPAYADLLDTRGYAYYRLKDFDKARSDFDRCTELYPPNSPSAATPRFHLALTYEAMKRRAEALEQLRIALDANGASLRFAREQADSGRTTYAIKVLKEALLLQTQLESLKATLGLSGQASGPAPQEVTDAVALLDQLQKGSY